MHLDLTLQSWVILRGWEPLTDCALVPNSEFALTTFNDLTSKPQISRHGARCNARLAVSHPTASRAQTGKRENDGG